MEECFLRFPMRACSIPFYALCFPSQVLENSDLLLRNDANADLLEIHLENVVVTFEFPG